MAPEERIDRRAFIRLVRVPVVPRRLGRSACSRKFQVNRDTAPHYQSQTGTSINQ